MSAFVVLLNIHVLRLGLLFVIDPSLVLICPLSFMCYTHVCFILLGSSAKITFREEYVEQSSKLGPFLHFPSTLTLRYNHYPQRPVLKEKCFVSLRDIQQRHYNPKRILS